MADMVTRQELEAAKVDVKHAGEAVNSKKVITPRYGQPFKSIPLLSEELQQILNNKDLEASQKLQALQNVIEIALAAGAGAAGWTASLVFGAGGKNQQEINDFGGAEWWNKPGGYNLGATVKLENGDIVKSTVANNIVNPDIDMTGWVFDQGITAVTDLSESRRTDLNVALLKDEGFFYYDESKALDNNYGTVLNGWVRVVGAVLTPKMFGAKADGVTDDRISIRRMLAMTSVGYRSFDFEGLDHYCGEVPDTTEPVFSVVGVDNLRIVGARCFVKHTNFVPTNEDRSLFKFKDCNNLYADVYLEGEEQADFSDYNRGLQAVVIEVTDKVVKNAVIFASAKFARSAFETKMANDLPRPASGSNFLNIHGVINAESCTYAFRAVNCGENINLTINALNVGRSCFLVGVSNVNATVNSKGQARIADTVVKAYRNNAENIHIILNSDGQLDLAENIFVIEHQNAEQDTKINNVTLDVQVANRGTPLTYGRAIGVIGRQYDLAGQVQASTNAVTDNIQINLKHADVNVQPAIDFPSFNNSGGLVEVNFSARIRETNNFTIKHGGKYSVATAKNPSGSVLALWLKNIMPSSCVCIITFIGLQNTSDVNFQNTHIRQIKARVSSAGIVTVVGVHEDIALEGENWMFGVSFLSGRLRFSSTRNLSVGTSKFQVVVEPVVGGNYI